MSTVLNQKEGALEGGSATDEVLASSASVLETNFRGGKQKGLQQWFTPETAARLAADVIGESVCVLDPTAGDGSLLKFFEPIHSFGVEIDADQIKKSEGSYKPINGDLQHVYALIRRSFEFNAIVANPPFGLDWEEPTLRDGATSNSALLTLMMMNRLLTHDGQFAFINSTSGFDFCARQKDEVEGVYAVIDVPDLFHGTVTSSTIAFGVNPQLRQGEAFKGFERREMQVANLDLLKGWVLDLRKKAIGYGRVAQNTGYYERAQLAQNWPVLQKEYDRRTDKRLKKQREAKFDVELFAGTQLNILPSPFTSLVLTKLNKLQLLSRLNGASVNYFIQNERDWLAIKELEKDELITVDPRVTEKVEAALFDTRRVLCPLYPLKPVQRLGFLSDIDTLLCTKSNAEHGHEAGTRYDLNTQTVTLHRREMRPVQIKSGKKAGEWEDREFTIYRKALKISVGHWSLTDSEEDTDDIQYLVDHFEMPDPGDVGTKFPEETEAMRQLIRRIQDEWITPNSIAFRDKHGKKEDGTWKFPEVTFKHFQIEDLARLLVKDDGLISWEQGLGKTLGALAFAIAHVLLNNAKEQVLITCPKDLIAQWKRETERFLGKELTVIKSHGQAKKIAGQLKRGATGWFITYPEALAVVGTRKSKPMAEIVVEEKQEQKLVKGTDRHGYYTQDEAGIQTPCDYNDPEKVGYGYIRPRFDTIIKQITSREVCPECKSDRRSGWNGLFCEAEQQDGSICGYTHYEVRVKPIGSLLSVAFKKGIGILDEATMVGGSANGADSQRSKVLRGMRFKRKLGQTGTPIKNYITQAYWVMWWCLGNDSPRFGYDYDGGKLKFEDNFSVIEVARGKDGKQLGRKSMPEVTNLSRFWRMTASSFIRRRKEDTGEPIVSRHFFEINVPLGQEQQRQINKWAKCFAKFFREKYPEKDYDPAWVEQAAPLLGLGQKLEYAELAPLADPDVEWTPDAATDPLGQWQNIEASNFTPATLKAMELAMALVKSGQKVLIGSPLVKVSRFLAEELQTKNVKAIHVLDETDTTQNPDARAKTVYDFQSNDVDVLCTGVQAIRFGHNLDSASAVILLGLPWDFETMDQFIARVHRLTSTRPVRVYIITPGTGTVSERKWNLLKLKSDTSSLALDGHIVKKDEVEINQAAIIRELMEKGVPLTGEEVAETDVEKAWAEFPKLAEYEAPEGLLVRLPGEPKLYGIGPVLWALDAFFKKAREAAEATELLEEPARDLDEWALEILSASEALAEEPEVPAEPEEVVDETEELLEALAPTVAEEPAAEAEPDEQDEVAVMRTRLAEAEAKIAALENQLACDEQLQLAV